MPAHSISSSDADSGDESDRPVPRENLPFSLKNSINFDVGMRELQVDSAIVSLEEIEDPENDIWLVTTPKSVDPQSLINIPLALQYPSKLRVDEKDFEALFYGEKEQLMLIVPNEQGVLKLTKKETMGKVVITEDVHVPNIDADALFVKPSVQSPGNFKRRHPIYGHDLEGLCQVKQPSSPRKKKKRN